MTASLKELRALAQSADAQIACRAIEQLAQAGDRSPETAELLVDLMSTEHSYLSDWSDPWGDTPEYHVWFDAGAAIRTLGGAAVDALAERIVTPAKPGDEKLLERSAHIGRPLLDLARILVADGDARRSRAAEPIVAEFAGELSIDDALGIYLAICERDRGAGFPRSKVLDKIWPRFATPEGKSAIWNRWAHRELRAWIEGRSDDDPSSACALLALLVVLPDEAVPVAVALLRPLSEEGRWLALEAMLEIDLEQTGLILAADPEIWAWAEHKATRWYSTTLLEHRLILAVGASDKAMPALLRSRLFQNNTEELLPMFAALEDKQVWRVRFLQVIANWTRQEHTVIAAVQRVLHALGTGSTGGS